MNYMKKKNKESVGELCLQGYPQAATDENKSTKTRSAWGRNVASLSKEKGQEPFPQIQGICVCVHMCVCVYTDTQ